MEDKDTKIISGIEEKAEHITPAEVDKVLSSEKVIDAKEDKVKREKLFKLFDQVKLGMQMMKDFKAKRYTQVPWRTVGLITAALLYFINPLDIIPDILPIFGYTDDAVAFAAIFKSIQTDLKNYCHWKGLDPANYF
ncbi:MAG TPA: YkvA family protein [Ignavibacteria bacterium]|nr:YkvA family protein [Ignavibacteria bacterium]